MMDGMYLVVCVLAFIGSCQGDPIRPVAKATYDRPIGRYNKTFSEDLCVTDPGTFVCKWFSRGTANIDSPTRPGDEYVQVAATTSLDPYYHSVGTEIINAATRNMNWEVFVSLAQNGRVGLFTDEDETTIFPEYEIYRDTPECAGRCDGTCSITCTGDGRKYDSLAGVGGVRATCVDDNFMCLSSDPYGNTYSVLIHEFAHTVHGYALTSYWQGQIYNAWYNAYASGTWDVNSYAMSNDYEYFAEAGGVYFNVNFHGSSSGGMNSCGKPPGQFCSSEAEARYWLWQQDPAVYSVLVYVFSDNDGDNVGGLTVCP